MRKELSDKSVLYKWYNPLWEPPYLEFRDYLGVRVSLYFAWVAFFGRMLWLLGFIGIPVYAVYRASVSAKATAALRLVFTIIMPLWSSLSWEAWKRRNAQLNMLWGTMTAPYHGADVRAEYKGNFQLGFYCKGGWVSVADLAPEGKDEELDTPDASAILPSNKHGDFWKATRRKYFGFAATAFVSAIVCAATIVLLWFRKDFIQVMGGSNIATFIPGAINAVFIVIVDAIWKILSEKLTIWENHRSEIEHENALIYKRFAFQFVSNYSSLFFLAFITPFVNGGNSECAPAWGGKAGTPNCFGNLEMQLLSLLSTKITVQQALEVLVPWLMTHVNRMLAKLKKTERKVTHISLYYLEASLPHYHSTLEDYSEIVLLYGYVSLFAVAFPLAPFFVAFNNVVEVRVDAFKILMLHKRINSDVAYDIGAWKHIMTGFAYLSVLTNLGLFIFTADGFSYLVDIDTWKRWFAFLIMENILIIAKIFFEKFINDVSSKTLKIVARQEFDVYYHFKANARPEFMARPRLIVTEEDEKAIESVIKVIDQASDEEFMKTASSIDLNEAEKPKETTEETNRGEQEVS